MYSDWPLIINGHGILLAVPAWAFRPLISVCAAAQNRVQNLWLHIVYKNLGRAAKAEQTAAKRDAGNRRRSGLMRNRAGTYLIAFHEVFTRWFVLNILIILNILFTINILFILFIWFIWLIQHGASPAGLKNSERSSSTHCHALGWRLALSCCLLTQRLITR